MVPSLRAAHRRATGVCKLDWESLNSDRVFSQQLWAPKGPVTSLLKFPRAIASGNPEPSLRSCPGESVCVGVPPNSRVKCVDFFLSLEFASRKLVCLFFLGFCFSPQDGPDDHPRVFGSFLTARGRISHGCDRGPIFCIPRA